MSILFDNPLPAIGCGDPGDPIAFALETSATSGLRRLTASTIPASEKTLWSVSFWGKSPFPAAQVFLGAAITTSSGEQLKTTEDGYTRYYNAANILAEAQGMRRDPSNHAHYLWIFDTDNAVTSDRIRLFVNGQRVPVSGALTNGYNSYLNRAGVYQYVGCVGYSNGSIAAGGGILSDAILIGGRACAPEEFGYTNAYGHFVPRKFKGQGQGPNAYGATGWHLSFSDPLNLGLDVSGNGNHFTSIGLTTQNQVTDTPSNNFATMNPLVQAIGLSDGNLLVQTIVTYNKKYNFHVSTEPVRIPIECEFKIVSAGAVPPAWQYISITNKTVLLDTPSSTEGLMLTGGGTWLTSDGLSGSGNPSFGAGSVVGLRIDPINRTVALRVNDSHFYPAIPLPVPGPYYICVSDGHSQSSMKFRANFGQHKFQYDQPDRWATLSSSNLTCPAILNPDKYCTVRLSGAGTDVTDLPWNPTISKTLCISKRRDAANAWRIADTVRGNGVAWSSNVGGIETSSDFEFTTTGIRVGADPEYQGQRIDYFWRASPKAGFDIVTLNHTVGTPSTIAHATGGPVDWAWVAKLDGGDVFVHHKALPTGGYVRLNQNTAAQTLAGWFTSTANTVTLGGAMPTGRYVMYLWREVPQFSRFSSRQGNGNADGVFTPLDFEPRIEFTKSTLSSTAHYIRDSDRDTFNPVTRDLALNASSAEETTRLADFLSNGVKVRSASAGINNSGTEYLCAHFARTPIKFARAR